MFEQRTLMKGAITMNMKDYISNYCTACGGKLDKNVNVRNKSIVP